MTLSAEINATSRIDTVTVYPSGAEVTRILKVKIDAGDHTIVLKDLPQSAIPGSIRVEGKATGALQIGSVDTRMTSIPRGDQEMQAAERKRIEREIETLNDDKSRLTSATIAAEQQQLLLKNLAEMPGKPISAGAQPGSQPDWLQLLTIVGERTLAVQNVMHDTRLKMRDIDRQIADLSRRLGEVAPAAVARTEVRVNVAAGTAVEADMTVRYQVSDAGWTPLYDARLLTGQRNTAAKLQLVRQATIRQRTNEPWTDVAISLSTTRPTAGTAAPELVTMSVDFNLPPPMPRPMAAPAMAPDMARAKLRNYGPPAAAAPAAAPAPELVAVQDVQSTVDITAFQALFAISGRTSVPENGETKRVQISTDDLDPQLIVRTIPRLDPTAYLYAKLTAPKAGAPILPGQVSLFRDGTFVGNGRMALLAPGETHELGFGRDDRVKVKRNVLEDKTGSRGIITSSRVESRSYEIVIKSLHTSPVQVHLLDRIPVSKNEAIKVETTFRREPTKRDVEARRGVVLWEIPLAPDAEQTVAFGYKVTGPAERPLNYFEESPQAIFEGMRVRF